MSTEKFKLKPKDEPLEKQNTRKDICNPDCRTNDHDLKKIFDQLKDAMYGKPKLAKIEIKL